jgi:CubicO group peptidase (beta-lactamase class C family)
MGMHDLDAYINNIKLGPYFDRLAVGIIDFENKDYFTFRHRKYIFDLASLTKPLVLGVAFLKNPDLFDKEDLLLLEHRGGLPSWGILHRDNWQVDLDSYSVKESETLYSDYSALKLMLNLNKKLDGPLKDYISTYWDEGLFYWRDRAGFTVHDPNAQNILEFTSHAGLFSSVTSLCLSLMKLDEQTDFVRRVGEEKSKRPDDRFIWGWDSVTDPEQTLAGVGCSPNTFGHLGFTGTSIWIDPERRWGQAILSNVTKLYWYERTNLNEIRRSIGSKIWSLDVLEQERSK